VSDLLDQVEGAARGLENSPDRTITRFEHRCRQRHDVLGSATVAAGRPVHE
jgi:hypothetical protein